MRNPISDESFIEKLSIENGIEVQLTEMETFFEELENQMVFYFPQYTYVYRDLNWGNIFFDKENDLITFIDAGLFHGCLNAEGEPKEHLVYALKDFQMAFYMLNEFIHIFRLRK